MFLRGLLVSSLVTTGLFATPQASNQRETISLGRDLTLGMSEDSVIAKLAESYNLRKEEPPDELRAKGLTTMWTVDEKGEKGRWVGMIFFASGKLAAASKPLLPPEDNEVEFGRQLYFAMRDFEFEGNSQCTIETESGEVPDYAFKRATLRCGKKSIVIDVQRVKESGESVQLNEELNAQ